MPTKADYLQLFFDFLGAQDINYCVVGDTKGVPDIILSDIDIVVSVNSLQQLSKLVRGFVDKEQLSLVQLLQHEQTAFYFVLAWMTEKGEIQYLHPDICTDYYRNGKKLLSAQEIVEGCVEARTETGEPKGFRVPRPDMEFIYYLLKKVDKDSLETKHVWHLREEWRKDPQGCIVQIRRFWPGEKAEVLIQAAMVNEWGTVVASLSDLQKSLHSKLSFSFIDLLREFARKVRRVIWPTGLFVVFLGPDGSGKSSVIDKVIPKLSPAFRKTCNIHLRPGLGSKKNRKGTPVTDPHGKPVRGKPSSIFKVLYFLYDYCLGYLFKVRPMLVRSTLVVFDRYYHDLLIDPKRYRYGGGMWLARLVGKLIPKPDLVILLDAPSEVLQRRKQEVSFEETSRQRESYLYLVEKLKNGIVIDASQSIENVTQDTTKSILDFMERRTSRR